MARANYKVTISDHDYYYTTYTAWVQATSKNQAIALGAALAGQQKMKLEFERMHREPLWPESFIDPGVRLETVSLNEYWEHRDEVIVSDIND